MTKNTIHIRYIHQQIETVLWAQITCIHNGINEKGYNDDEVRICVRDRLPLYCGAEFVRATPLHVVEGLGETAKAVTRLGSHLLLYGRDRMQSLIPLGRVQAD